MIKEKFYIYQDIYHSYDILKKVLNISKQGRNLRIPALFLVEAGGVEPPSENVLTGTSPGADGLLRFPSQSASRHAQRVGSFMMHGALKALRTHGPHSNDALFRLVGLPDRTAAG